MVRNGECPYSFVRGEKAGGQISCNEVPCGKIRWSERPGPKIGDKKGVRDAVSKAFELQIEDHPHFRILPVKRSSMLWRGCIRKAHSYRLTGQHPEYEGPDKLRVGSDYLHGYRIVRRWPVSDSDVAGARGLLTSVKTYGDRGLGARCFFPGFAFTFGDGTAVVDVMICLECRWVIFHFGGRSMSVAPTDDGLVRLREIYQKLIASVPTDAE